MPAQRSSPRRAGGAPDWRGWLLRWRRQQERYLPQREARFAAMLDLVEAVASPELRAVDLASGPGAISRRLLDRFPRARVTAVDYHPVLLRLGREAIGTLGGRLTWVDADLRRSGWVRKLPYRPFDAVLSTTALHWLSEPDLGRLLREVRGILRPGGIFLNGDHMAYSAAEPRLRELARTARHRASDAYIASHASEDWDDWWAAIDRVPELARERAEARRRFPGPHGEEPEVPLDTHLRLLRAAGFAEADVVWQQFDQRVVAAIAPERRATSGRQRRARSL
jgi:SAM-dependent methyltransferase